MFGFMNAFMSKPITPAPKLPTPPPPPQPKFSS